MHPAASRWFDLLVSSRLGDDGRCVGATVTLSLARLSDPGVAAYGAAPVRTSPAAGDRGPADRTAVLDDLLARLDTVVRRLFSSGLRLTGLHERLGRDDPGARALADAIGELDEAVAEVRRAATSGAADR